MKTIDDFQFTPIQKKILSTVYRNPGVSRRELAGKAGISEKSVIRYAGDFLNRHILINQETCSNAVGRHAELLRINPEWFTVLAVDVGAYSAKIGIVDLSGRILFRKIWVKGGEWTPHNFTAEMLCEKMRQVLEESGLKPVGLGLSISGLIDRNRQSIRYCPNLAQLRDIQVQKAFGETLGLSVCLDTSARCLALAEARYGGHKDASNLLYISAGHSISAGVILDGKIFRGATGSAGELGHVKVSDDSSRCTCGSTGCLELYATVPMIASSIRGQFSKFGGYSPLLALTSDWSSLQVSQIQEGFRLKDKIVLECMTEAGHLLGRATSSFVSSYNPSLVVFGGSLGELYPYVIEEAIREIEQVTLSSTLQDIVITKSALDSGDAAILGAALQVQEEFFGL